MPRKAGDRMASISTSIELYDRVSAPINKMIGAMQKMCDAFDSIDSAVSVKYTVCILFTFTITGIDNSISLFLSNISFESISTKYSGIYLTFDSNFLILESWSDNVLSSL